MAPVTFDPWKGNFYPQGVKIDPARWKYPYETSILQILPPGWPEVAAVAEGWRPPGRPPPAAAAGSAGRVRPRPWRQTGVQGPDNSWAENFQKRKKSPPLKNEIWRRRREKRPTVCPAIPANETGVWPPWTERAGMAPAPPWKTAGGPADAAPWPPNPINPCMSIAGAPVWDHGARFWFPAAPPPPPPPPQPPNPSIDKRKGWKKSKVLVIARLGEKRDPIGKSGSHPPHSTTNRFFSSNGRRFGEKSGVGGRPSKDVRC